MTAVPNRAEFFKSTDLTMVTTGKRANDTFIQRIDVLLDMFHMTPAGPARVTVLALIYFAADQWLKLAASGSSQVNSRRSAGMNTFYATIVQRLSEETDRPINMLPRWLQDTFGKSMTEHGSDTDDSGEQVYMSAEERAKYQLIFRNGLAYQRNWWGNGKETVLAHTADRNTTKTEISQYFCGYAVGMDGTFYSGPHNCRRGGLTARYHSSYLKGDDVLCAGELKIEEGRVTEINDKSGHYQPGQNNLAMAVEALAANGVDVDGLRVEAHGGVFDNGRNYIMRNLRNGFVRDTRTDRERGTYLAASTMTAHATRVRIYNELVLLKEHWLPRGAAVPSPGHGVIKRTKCDVCNRNNSSWEAMMKLVADSPSGIASVQIPRVAGINQFAPQRAR